MEKVIETKICKCGAHFEITDKDLEFYKKISPIFNGVIYEIPAPDLCPDCRQQRRLAWRNERNLYKRNCDATGKSIISMYSPDKKYKVYSQEFWWSDSWNALDYGRDFDFTRPFFEQFKELNLEVPHVSLITDYTKDENSAYTNFAGSNKNCYLIFDSDFNRDCINLTSSTYNENCIDCHSTHNSKFCYQTIGVENCYECFYMINSIDCSNCYECDNCIGCKNCFGCENLRNAEYFIENKEYSKENYFIELTKKLNNKNLDFKRNLKLPKKFMISNKAENASGNYIYNSNNISDSYEIYDSEDCKYCYGMHDLKTSYDVTGFGIIGLHKIYDSHIVGLGGSDILFSNSVFNNCNNVLYSNYICYNSSNIFGCVSLVSKEYCILNKQYTKEEYEILVPKIIEHMKKTSEWGGFFPSNLSPFGYNETVANDYFPLEREDAILSCRDVARYVSTDMNHISTNANPKFNWSDYEPPKPEVSKILPASKLPTDITDIPDDILNWAIECDVTNKPFRIVKQELDFYRKHSLPIPRIHPDQRNLDRMHLRNPRKIYDRKCMKCGVDIKTTYSPQMPETVYCESCYDKEMN